MKTLGPFGGEKVPDLFLNPPTFQRRGGVGKKIFLIEEESCQELNVESPPARVTRR